MTLMQNTVVLAAVALVCTTGLPGSHLSYFCPLSALIHPG